MTSIQKHELPFGHWPTSGLEREPRALIAGVDGIDRNERFNLGREMAFEAKLWAAHHDRGSLESYPANEVIVRPIFCGELKSVLQPRAGQCRLGDFEAKTGQAFVTYAEDDFADCVIYVGLGHRKVFDKQVWVKAMVAAFKTLAGLKTGNVIIELPAGLKAKKWTFLLAREVAITARMCGYEYSMKSLPKTPAKKGNKPEAGNLRVKYTVTTAADLSHDEQVAVLPEVKRGLDEGDIIGRAINFQRDMVNDPPNICTPSYLATRARQVGYDTGISVRVRGRADCANERMNLLLAVARGSAEEPQFIEMNWAPANAVEGITLGVVGKGVTLDSGGLDIKSADGMRTMQSDMTGAAMVIAFMEMVARLKLPFKVKGFAACTENMIGPSSYRPGDIIKARSGATVLIDNTDAEGRLCLADALDFAVAQGVTHIVELSTLTGASVMALGDDGAALFSNNDEWRKDIESAAAAAGEQVWHMPVWERHNEQIKSPLANLVNTGGKSGGGACTAAAFLMNFVGKTPFVHLDIAPVAYRPRGSGRYTSEATGWGMLTLLELAQNLARRR